MAIDSDILEGWLRHPCTIAAREKLEARRRVLVEQAIGAAANPAASEAAMRIAAAAATECTYALVEAFKHMVPRGGQNERH